MRHSNTATLMMPSGNVETHPAILGHHVHGFGTEKVLVFHDWMGDSDNYQPILPYLDVESFSYVFADLRGYGKSRHLSGEYSVEEVSADAYRLVDELGWDRFHVIGHSMTGMAVQRMAISDWETGARRLKSIIAITPVSAEGYPADGDTKSFLWSLIHKQALSELGFSMLTGRRLLPAWGRIRTDRHLQASTAEALRGYYRMWLETDFSAEVRRARIGTPVLVIGGRQDLPGFQEEYLRKTFGKWYTNVNFMFITDSGHYPMHETPVYLASLVEGFLKIHS
jgi:pimeloyl-ACP methyl ester carboxylesterase